MDFITGLPPSKGYTTIMVIVDRLTKYAHFAPLPTRFDALRVARLFVETVVKHHGFPATLVSDRDPIFLSEVWSTMFRLSGTTLHYSTAYHPQSDGQTEVRNRGLEQYLRSFAADRPSSWANFLPWAELALNCFHHEGLGTSPFRALYGRHPPALVAVRPSANCPPDVAELIVQRSALLIDLRRNLERAKQRMTDVANRGRRDVQFNVGDLVLLKLQLYRQHSVARPLSSKLSKRFYGPFEVLERIGPVAYRLKLPDDARIHNVFHVSLLRKFVAGSPLQVIPFFSKDFLDARPAIAPLELMEKRVTLQDGVAVPMCRIRWSANQSLPDTWEPMSWVEKTFPHLLADKEIDMGGS